MKKELLTTLAIGLVLTLSALPVSAAEPTTRPDAENDEKRIEDILDMEYLHSPYYARLMYQQLWNHDNNPGNAYQQRLAEQNPDATAAEKQTAAASDFYAQGISFGTKGTNAADINNAMRERPYDTLLGVMTNAAVSPTVLAAVDAKQVSPGGAIEQRQIWQEEAKRAKTNPLPGGTLGAQNLNINLNAF